MRRYNSSLLTTSKVNNDGVAIPCCELATSDDIVLTALAQLAVCQTGAARCLVSLFDQGYQHFIAEATQTIPLGFDHVHNGGGQGLWMCGTAIPRAHSICEYTLLAQDPSQFEHGNVSLNQLPVLVVPDLQADDRFFMKPYCQPGNPSRFYAAVPIRSGRGINIGVLCVTSPEPRSEWNEQYSSLMRTLSVAIMEHLEANQSKSAYRRSERMIRGLGLFIEGKSTLSSWHSGPAKAALSESPKKVPAVDNGSPQLQTVQTELVDGGSLEPKSLGSEQPTGPDTVFDTGNEENPERQPKPFNTRNTHANDPSTDPGGLKWAEDFQPGPNPKVETFSEAANIVREAVQTDGCVFLDANLGRFFAFPTHTHSRETKVDEARNRTPSGQSNGGIGDNNHCNGGDDTSSSSDDDQLSSDEPAWAPCPILGFSTSESPSLESAESPPPQIPMAQKFLAKLLQRYPKGRIFNFDADGELQSNDLSEEDSCSAEQGPPGNLSHRHYHSETHRRSLNPSRRCSKPWARQNEGHTILRMFPGARSIAFAPVWDPRKQRWCSGAFVYTLNPTRVFTVGGELNYLRAFGILAITETLRLRTLIANKAKSDALSSLSHELRSPLHGAVLGIELLRDTELTVFQDNMAHTIETCCRTLADTVDHLLDYSKVNKFFQAKKMDKQETEPRGLRQVGQSKSVEAGLMSLHKYTQLDSLVEEVIDGVYAGFNFQHMSVKQLTKRRPTSDSDMTAIRRLDSMQAMEELGPSLTEKGDVRLTFGEVSVLLEMDSNCPWMFYTQPGAIRRIVMNLFGNALKYTPSGVILVSLKQVQSKSASSVAETVVKIKVSDTGKGMSEDYLRNELYKPFSQEDHLAPGTGLGLSFVKQITSQLRGHVSVDSCVNVGTTVLVSLPLTQPPPPSSLDDARQVASEADSDFQQHVKGLRNLSVRLIGFGDDLTTEKRPTLDGTQLKRKLFLERICLDWLLMEIVVDAESPNQSTPPDLILWTEDAVFKASQQADKVIGAPGVVICTNALVAYENAVHCDAINQRGVFEFVSQPQVSQPPLLYYLHFHSSMDG